MPPLKNGIQKIKSRVVEVEDFNEFAVIGDPGCDGLGAEIMSVFSKGLEAASGTDFTLILGDIVPFGSKNFYRNVSEFISLSAKKPVFALCGNHDTEFYEDFFGSASYAIADGKTLIVILDNSKRKVSEESLDVLRFALGRYPGRNIVLAMHIPPPNRISPNAIDAEEWAKVTRILEPHKRRLRYVLCGHIHSCFEDEIEGARLVMTGGGGARIEEVAGIQAPYYHWVKFAYKDGVLTHEKVDISPAGKCPEDPGAAKMLSDSFAGECAAHVRYRLYAEDAERRGLPFTAKLFRAAADAEFYHARNFFYALSAMKDPAEALRESAANERREAEEFYRSCLDYVKTRSLGVAAYAFTDAIEAERVHGTLFEDALERVAEGHDAAAGNFYTCTSCGNTFFVSAHPRNCPVCGAPMDKITEIRP
jgi:rubrerythrin/Icc-related predicted phosphoesterase